MNVAALIARLSTLPPEAPVYVRSFDGELGEAFTVADVSGWSGPGLEIRPEL